MFTGRRRQQSSFGPDGRRLSNIGGNHSKKPWLGQKPSKKCYVPRTKCNIGSSNKLFSSSTKLVVQRAPIMCGLNVASVNKAFVRPMLKRRAYDARAEAALRGSTLGQRRRMDGMARLMARAGKGLHYHSPKPSKDDDNSDSDSDSDSDKEEDRPFEPLCVWVSPHQGGPLKGLPSTRVTELRPDEYGIEQPVSVVREAGLEEYGKESQYVPAVLAKWLRPHQREGVKFMYECVMGMKNFDGHGCILADDMGLGKTLQSVTLIYTLLKTSITKNQRIPTVRRVIVVCPCSLVKNWDNEFAKWLGAGTVKTLPIAEADRKTVEKNLDAFVKTKLFSVLICSYECLRSHVGRLTSHKDCCDLLVCDEAHRLKNRENQTSVALNSLPCARRVLLTGTPMQNDLQEFFAMVDFTNPGVIGTQEEFRKNILFPILRGREPDATSAQKQKMMTIQNNMSSVVNEFILRRINTLNAQHLPPKLVQVVCCKLTDIQQNMYQHLVQSKDMQHVLDGKQVNCLSSIQMLMKLSNHPRLVCDDDTTSGSGRRGAAKRINYAEDEKSSAAPGADGMSKFLPLGAGGGGRMTPIRPEWSGKMFVLYRLMKEMRKPGNGNDKIVIVSNYTQTLDLIGKMCRENSWGFCRLDGSIGMKKRQRMVDDFNDPTSSLIAFLLSSKAGGCGLNLIGGNRLVLFDPDWNPAVDKQAAARCWRDGQKKRCFTYRFLATGTVEEKIFQRQLSKEGLQSVVDDKEQVNALSTKDLRNLFKLRQGTPSDTHDKLRCERCKIIADDAEQEAIQVLPKKITACQRLLEEMLMQEDGRDYFATPLRPEDYGKSAEEYDKLVKQPIDLGTIKARLMNSNNSSCSSGYKSVSAFSKDVNRIFANVLKVWEPGEEIADAARRLQSWWVEEWTKLVPQLMIMKVDKNTATTDHNDESSNATETTSNDLTCAYINNERGENFQEQIGMPDEENMRHWSHHFSPDTVDDPVFRAAMRGTDSVSFIFGLEVTWSLIQQRQQEEEEKQAMLELEELQKLEGEEEKQAKTSNIEKEKADTTDQIAVEEIDEISETKNYVSDETMDGSVILDEKREALNSSIYDLQDVVNNNDSLGTNKICSVEDENFESNKAATPSKSPPPQCDPLSQSPNGWACSKCTYENKSSSRKCGMCTAKRPSKGKKRNIDNLS